ncbi:MAG: hypothetical protein HYZ15_03370 [Sphingobacteriales bacterium]|nr:hypothetical protein [Sphingobacteriales bacterium]
MSRDKKVHSERPLVDAKGDIIFESKHDFEQNDDIQLELFSEIILEIFIKNQSSDEQKHE